MLLVFTAQSLRLVLEPFPPSDPSQPVPILHHLPSLFLLGSLPDSPKSQIPSQPNSNLPLHHHPSQDHPEAPRGGKSCQDREHLPPAGHVRQRGGACAGGGCVLE
jgi:hypothetical protein